MLADMATRLVPREAAASIDELIAGATERRPLGGTDGKSGSTLERVVIDGERFVLKHLHPDDDWTMRGFGDLGCRPVAGVDRAGCSTRCRRRSTTPSSARPPGSAATAGAARCSCAT